MIRPTIIRHIVDQHAEDAAFLWRLRDAAASGAGYTLDALADLDERVEAHLDGLRVAGPHAWEACAEVLSLESAGEVFVVTALALHEGFDEKVAELLDLAGLDPLLARGIVSAIGWTPLERLGATLSAFLDPQGPPALQRLGIAGAALHRVPLGPTLAQALYGSDPPLVARALRAAGELGRTDLQKQVAQHLGSPDDELRFWAAWSSVLLGEHAAAETLWAFPEDAPRAPAAYALAARVTPVATARQRIEAIADERTALGALAALGDPGALARAVAGLRQPELARVAAHTISTITGLDVRAPGLLGSPPDAFRAGPTDDPEDEDVALDPDEKLPWPDAGALESASRKLGLSAGVRHLAGEPIADGVTARVLRHGTQSQRIAAAIERCLVAPAEPLTEVRAPGFRQLGRAQAQAQAPAAAERSAPPPALAEAVS